MKTKIFGFLFASLTAHAGPAVSGGGSPFAYSASLIQTMLSSPMVWQKIFGSVEKIQRIDQDQKSATFQISTTESVAIKNTQGSTIGWAQQPCETVITISNVSTDVFIPKLEVTGVDFSKCPSVQN